MQELAQSHLSGSATTIYSVPLLATAVVNHILVANPTDVAHTVTLWHDDGAILPPWVVTPGGWGVWDGVLALPPYGSITGEASGPLTVTIHGTEA